MKYSANQLLNDLKEADRTKFASGVQERAKAVVEKFMKMNKGDVTKTRKDIINHIMNSVHAKPSKEFMNAVWDEYGIVLKEADRDKLKKSTSEIPKDALIPVG